jgi:hypothetical protein
MKAMPLPKRSLNEVRYFMIRSGNHKVIGGK